MRSALGSFVALTALCAVGTYLTGWWAVPIIAAGWTLALPRHGAVLTASAAGAASWAVLLAIASGSGRIDDVAAILAGILGTQSLAIYALTLLYGSLLAGSAALVARAINPSLVRRRGV